MPTARYGGAEVLDDDDGDDIEAPKMDDDIGDRPLAKIKSGKIRGGKQNKERTLSGQLNANMRGPSAPPAQARLGSRLGLTRRAQRCQNIEKAWKSL